MAAEGDGGGRGRRSWRPFPRYPLRTAEEIARKVLALGDRDGLQAETLASALGHRSAASGTFRTKLAAARAYGAVEYGDDGIRLGEWGAALAAPTSDEEQQNARRQAFLAVEPFHALWRRFAGGVLPEADDVVHNVIVRELGYPSHSADEFLDIFRQAGREAGLLQRSPDGNLRVAELTANGDEAAVRNGHSAEAPDVSSRLRSERGSTRMANDLGRHSMAPAGEPHADGQRGPVRVIMRADVSDWSLDRVGQFLGLLADAGLLDETEAQFRSKGMATDGNTSDRGTSAATGT